MAEIRHQSKLSNAKTERVLYSIQMGSQTRMETGLSDRREGNAVGHRAKITTVWRFLVTGIVGTWKAANEDGIFLKQIFYLHRAVMTCEWRCSLAEIKYGKDMQAVDYIEADDPKFGLCLTGSIYEVSPDIRMFTSVGNDTFCQCPSSLSFFGIQPDVAMSKSIIRHKSYDWENASIHVLIGTNEISMSMKAGDELSSKSVKTRKMAESRSRS